jgi:DnaJ-class molecular chaperone
MGSTTSELVICPHCKGNGFITLSWESDTTTQQCEICDSQGELDNTKHYKQSWEQKLVVQGKEIVTRSLYFGPLLDPESFPDYKIHKN